MNNLVLLVSILFVTLCNSQCINNFDSLDFAAGGQYVAVGSYNNRFVVDTVDPVVFNPVGQELPALLIMDATNNRFFLNHTNNEHWLFSNISYLNIPGIFCFFRDNYTYFDWLRYYSADVLVSETGNINTFAGSIFDHHACGTRIGSTVRQNRINGRIKSLSFHIQFEGIMLNQNICFTEYWTFAQYERRTGRTIDSFFEIPVSCNSSIQLCGNFYRP